MDPSLFIDEVPSYFLCSVCLNVVELPVEHTLCDNNFCSNCLSMLISRRSCCPLCRGCLKQSNIRPLHRILKVQYDSLKMKCMHANDGCNASFPLSEKERHENECNYHTIECQYCQIRLNANDLSTHEATRCPMYPVSCPVMECDAKCMVRQDLPLHMQTYSVLHVEMLQATIQELRRQIQRIDHLDRTPPVNGCIKLRHKYPDVFDD